MSKASQLADYLRGNLGVSVDEPTAEAMLKTAQSRGDNGYVQWMSRDGQTFSPATLTRRGLVPGLYEVGIHPMSGLYFEKMPVATEGIIRLPDTAGDSVIDEIKSFWDKEKLFRDYGLTYKRGIIMYGPPGSGKTCTIKLVSDDVIKRGGIVVKFSDAEVTSRGLRVFREVQPETPCVVLMEDLDSILRYSPESSVINLLDGVDKIDKVVFLATTNYPEQLGERVINRPSRFDRRYFIGPPNEKSRKIYFEHLLSQGSKSSGGKSEIDLGKWVKDTEGMSIAHLKELFVACIILGTDYKEAIDTLRAMDNLPSSDDFKEKKTARSYRMGDSTPQEAPAIAAWK
jgi:hypothetical protein